MAPTQGLVHPSVALGTNQHPITWHNLHPKKTTGVTLVTAAAHLTALPTTDSNHTTGQWIVTGLLPKASARRLVVAVGHATSADDKTAEINVFAINEMVAAAAIAGRKVVTEYLRRPLLVLNVIAGSLAVNADSKQLRDPDGGLNNITFCDTITPTTDYTLNNSATQVLEIANGIMELHFDGDGSPWLAFAVKPASGCGVWVGTRGM